MDDDPRQSRMGSRDGSRYPRRDVDGRDDGGRGGSYNGAGALVAPIVAAG